MWLRFLIFGTLGIVGEVAFGALKGLVARNVDLRGSSSLWMFPIYGLIPFFFPPVAHLIGALSWWGRGLVYMIALFCGEYLIGAFLTRFRLCPWHYSGKYAIHGLINLLYAPVWFIVGLAIEWVYPWAVAMSRMG